METASCGALSISAGSTTIKDVAVSKSGYTPLGIVGFYSGHVHFEVFLCRLLENSSLGTYIQLGAKNTYSSDITSSVSASVYVLYKKDI